MSRFDKYRNENKTPSKFDKYRNINSVETPSKFDNSTLNDDEGYLALLSKAALKGASSVLDLPNLIAQGVEGLGRAGAESQRREFEMLGYPGSDIKTPELNMFSSNIPTSANIRGYIKDKTGFNLEPQPSTPMQKILGNSLEYGGSLLSGGALGNLAKPGSVITKFLGSAKGAKGHLNNLALGSATGGVSGALQEIGDMSPLASDISSGVLVPVISKFAKVGGSGINNIKNIISPSAEHLEYKAAKDFKKYVPESDAENVIKLIEAGLPIINPTTAEVAAHSGISRLDRALSPNIKGMAEKHADNTRLIRNKLSNISPLGSNSEILGGNIIESLYDNLNKKKDLRGKLTEPYLKALKGDLNRVDIKNINSELSEIGKYEKGKIKSAYAKSKELLKSNTQDLDKDSLAETLKLELKKAELEGNTDRIKRLLNVESLIHKDSTASKINKALKPLNIKVKINKNPIPYEIHSTLAALNAEIESALTSGNKTEAAALINAKKIIEKGSSNIDSISKYRNSYAINSIPISEIEENKLMQKLIKKDIYDKNFEMPYEKVSDKILGASRKDQRKLAKELKNYPKGVKSVKSSVLDKFLNVSETGALDALGENKISNIKAKKFLKRNKNLISNFLNKKEIRDLNDINYILSRRQMVSDNSRALGSNTSADMSLISQIGKEARRKLPGASFISDFLDQKQKNRIVPLLEKALLEPEYAKKLLNNQGEVLSDKSKSYFYPNLTSIINRNLNDDAN